MDEGPLEWFVVELIVPPAASSVFTSSDGKALVVACLGKRLDQTAFCDRGRKEKKVPYML
jgi:hypothetical protein